MGSLGSLTSWMCGYSIEGKGKNQQGQQQAHGGEPLRRPNNAHSSEGEPQEVRAPVTHEDARGIEVMPKETKTAACKGCCKCWGKR